MKMHEKQALPSFKRCYAEIHFKPPRLNFAQPFLQSGKTLLLENVLLYHPSKADMKTNKNNQEMKPTFAVFEENSSGCVAV